LSFLTLITSPYYVEIDDKERKSGIPATVLLECADTKKWNIKHWFGFMQYLYIYVNAQMIPVETTPGIGGGEDKEQ
jgi:hypothetical protein